MAGCCSSPGWAPPEPVELAWSGVTSFLALDQQDLLRLASPLVLAVYLAAIASLIVRYVRGDDRTRRQLLWLVLAMIAMIAINWQRRPARLGRRRTAVGSPPSYR